MESECSTEKVTLRRRFHNLWLSISRPERLPRQGLLTRRHLVLQSASRVSEPEDSDTVPFHSESRATSRSDVPMAVAVGISRDRFIETKF